MSFKESLNYFGHQFEIMEKYTVMLIVDVYGYENSNNLNHVFNVFFILMLYNQALLKRNALYCCHIGLSAAVCLVSASEMFS